MGFYLKPLRKNAERTCSVRCKCGAKVRMVPPENAGMIAQCAACFAKDNPEWQWPENVNDPTPMGNALLRRQM